MLWVQLKSSQLLDLESGSLTESELVVDFGSLVGSSADSWYGCGVGLDFCPGSITGSGLVTDPEVETRLDFVTAECS